MHEMPRGPAQLGVCVRGGATGHARQPRHGESGAEVQDVQVHGHDWWGLRGNLHGFRLDIIDKSVHAYSAEANNNEFQSIISFECRGFEPTDFDFRCGWLGETERGKTFDVDLKDRVRIMVPLHVNVAGVGRLRRGRTAAGRGERAGRTICAGQIVNR